MEKERIKRQVFRRPAVSEAGTLTAVQPEIFRMEGAGHDSRFAQELVQYRQAPGIQRDGLEVAPPSDPAENEAEQMAEQVLREIDGNGAGASAAPQQEEPQMLVQGMGADISHTGAEVGSRIQARTGSGSALSGVARKEMESGFGTSFDHVRIHNDSESHQLSAAVGARAFTYGSDVFFGKGQYQPESRAGKHLLAHELTHTIQQTGKVSAKRIQKADEPKKYKIDYEEARKNNDKVWHLFLRSFNPFSAIGKAPVWNPIAFINATYDLQTELNQIYNKEGQVKVDGYFSPTIYDRISQLYKLQSSDAKMKEGLKGYTTLQYPLARYAEMERTVTKADPLISDWFRNGFMFGMVNKYTFFTMQEGDIGDHIQTLKDALSHLKYDLGADKDSNKFDAATKQALINFQKENGLEKPDGKLGAKTLKMLDIRMAKVPYWGRQNGSGGVPHYVFQVPVNDSHLTVNQYDFTTHALSFIFQITREEALTLQQQGWHITGYKSPTDTEAKAGFKRILCNVSLYESIKGKAESNRRSSGGGDTDWVTELRELVLEMENYNQLKSSLDKVKSLEDQISNVRTSIDPEDKWGKARQYREINDLRWQKSAAETSRDAEFKRLGITEEDLKKKSDRFKYLFQNYAYSIALKMLSENETSVNVQMQRYDTGNTNAVNEIAGLRTHLKNMNAKWLEADDLYFKGVAKEYYGDEKRYEDARKNFTSWGLYYQYKYSGYHPAEVIKEKTKPSLPNTWLEQALVKENEALENMLTGAKDHSVLLYKDLQLRSNAGRMLQKSDADLQKQLLEVLSNSNSSAPGIIQNIASTRQKLEGDRKLVYSMAPVVERARVELNIGKGTAAEAFIKEAIKEYNDAKFWKSMGMAALGLTLGLLALISGPVGWAALAGSIAVGGIDAYNTYQEITTTKTAARTAMDPSKALTGEDPGYFWFYFSLVAVGLDLVQVVKLFKPVLKSAINGVRGQKLAEEALAELLKEEKRLMELVKTDAKLADELAKVSAAIQKFDKDIVARNFTLLSKLADNPVALANLSALLNESKAFSEGMSAVIKLREAGKITEEILERMARMYSGAGAHMADELPQVLKLIESGGLAKNTELMGQVLADMRLQNALLNHPTDPAFLLREFEAWAATRSGTFTDFLKVKGYELPFSSTRKIATLGADFASLSHSGKNLRLLREVEPLLADALSGGKLPKHVEDAVRKALDADLIGATTSLERGGQRVKDAVSEAIGKSCKTEAELESVLKHLPDAGMQRAARESFTNLTKPLSSEGLAHYGKTADGRHTIKITTDGRIIICTECKFLESYVDNVLGQLSGVNVQDMNKVKGQISKWIQDAKNVVGTQQLQNAEEIYRVLVPLENIQRMKGTVPKGLDETWLKPALEEFVNAIPGKLRPADALAAAEKLEFRFNSHALLSQLSERLPSGLDLDALFKYHEAVAKGTMDDAMKASMKQMIETQWLASIPQNFPISPAMRTQLSTAVKGLTRAEDQFRLMMGLEGLEALASSKSALRNTITKVAEDSILRANPDKAIQRLYKELSGSSLLDEMAKGVTNRPGFEAELIAALKSMTQQDSELSGFYMKMIEDNLKNPAASMAKPLRETNDAIAIHKAAVPLQPNLITGSLNTNGHLTQNLRLNTHIYQNFKGRGLLLKPAPFEVEVGRLSAGPAQTRRGTGWAHVMEDHVQSIGPLPNPGVKPTNHYLAQAAGVTPAADAQSMADALTKILNSSEYANNMGKGAIEVSVDFVRNGAATKVNFKLAATNTTGGFNMTTFHPTNAVPGLIVKQ